METICARVKEDTQFQQVRRRHNDSDRENLQIFDKWLRAVKRAPYSSLQGRQCRHIISCTCSAFLLDGWDGDGACRCQWEENIITSGVMSTFFSSHIPSPLSTFCSLMLKDIRLHSSHFVAIVLLSVDQFWLFLIWPTAFTAIAII